MRLVRKKAWRGPQRPLHTTQLITTNESRKSDRRRKSEPVCDEACRLRAQWAADGGQGRGGLVKRWHVTTTPRPDRKLHGFLMSGRRGGWVDPLPPFGIVQKKPGRPVSDHPGWKEAPAGRPEPSLELVFQIDVDEPADRVVGRDVRVRVAAVDRRIDGRHLVEHVVHAQRKSRARQILDAAAEGVIG